MCECMYVCRGRGKVGATVSAGAEKSMCQCKKRELNTKYGLGNRNGECICVWCVGERVKRGGEGGKVHMCQKTMC